jgi:hypothetical protein
MISSFTLPCIQFAERAASEHLSLHGVLPALQVVV